ncbi:MAG: preprotein translocase subunit YajC [Bdellovibrionales bacterium]
MPAQAMPSVWEQFLPFAVIFIIFYFLIIRPQTRRIREQQKVLETLKKGDEVLTNSGILGTIEGLTEKFVTLEIASGVRIKMLKSQISGPVKETTK